MQYQNFGWLSLKNHNILHHPLYPLHNFFSFHSNKKSIEFPSEIIYRPQFITNLYKVDSLTYPPTPEKHTGTGASFLNAFMRREARVSPETSPATMKTLSSPSLTALSRTLLLEVDTHFLCNLHKPTLVLLLLPHILLNIIFIIPQTETKEVPFTCLNTLQFPVASCRNCT